MNSDYQDQSTVHGVQQSARDGFPEAIGVTILYHPCPSRIGEIAPLVNIRSKANAEISRVKPVFRTPDGVPTDALASTLLSRKPAAIQATGDGSVRISCSSEGTTAVADGSLIRDTVMFPETDLRRGIVLELAGCVVLLLHVLDGSTDVRGETPGLVGESAAVRLLKEAIKRVADLEVPVLLHGETGVGKELVASAIHEQSDRSANPYVCVNMAAIPPSLATSELFGHVKGAFTGATADRQGYFVEANGGTLFLDELGDTPAEVQPLLLRAIENKTVQPIGGKIRDVDVRLVAATDSNLEYAIEKGIFRRPLLERLSGYTIQIAPLRERREDIGRLFIHFLAKELEGMGQADRLQSSNADKPWIPAHLVAMLARYDWPGNVRQLQNVTRQIAIYNRYTDTFRIDPVIAKLFEGIDSRKDGVPRNTSVTPLRIRPADLSDEQIVEAWRRNQHNFNATASELNVSRTWLNTRLERIPGIRKAKDIPAEEIRRCAVECDHDLEAMAARLNVSVRGLQLQMKREKLS
ncbi:MAG: sigma-54-dependent Fis family transcriptional regulator [Deltaproteobacteria bacterium]|nr:sigma-54-dependent Fis family transcriptional regulator [Deltaproteobacteria bacterium]